MSSAFDWTYVSGSLGQNMVDVVVRRSRSVIFTIWNATTLRVSYCGIGWILHTHKYRSIARRPRSIYKLDFFFFLFVENALWNIFLKRSDRWSNVILPYSWFLWGFFKLLNQSTFTLWQSHGISGTIFQKWIRTVFRRTWNQKFLSSLL